MLKKHSENLSELIKLSRSSSQCKQLMEHLETERKGKQATSRLLKFLLISHCSWLTYSRATRFFPAASPSTRSSHGTEPLH